MDQQNEGEFDLQPAPRILRMLGEINLEQWRCLAELIDNSVDGFLNAKRKGEPLLDPEVVVSVPLKDGLNVQVSVRDNGPGMSAETLQNAVRAGWSGNNPLDDTLGMFGMGFNIATARLGATTTVWTARKEDAEWCGLKIDFDELLRNKHFKTPRLSRPKQASDEHGTEITVERLKPEQAAFFARTQNRNRVRNNLRVAYSSMLQPDGVPISFNLVYCAQPLRGQRHCIWDIDRVVDLPGRQVLPYREITSKLAARPYCINCSQWIDTDECPVCNRSEDVSVRERRIKGWIGIQRFLDSTQYGIDFIRNGRKIELENKELFFFKTEEGREPEYPIDDPRQRGRIVGEIHLDHCRVSYTKDRFDRTDPAWDEMVHLVRGAGPLRPDKAKERGYANNTSPLYLLYQSFRRSTAKNRKPTPGTWRRILVVKDNDLATEYATRFNQGDSEYQSDERWWALIEEEERKILLSTGVSSEPIAPSGNLDGFSDDPPDTDYRPEPIVEPSPPTPPPERRKISVLSRDFKHISTGRSWEVTAYETTRDDPELIFSENPWRLKVRTDGKYEFYVNPEHDVFRSTTMRIEDGLLGELAHTGIDQLRGENLSVEYSYASLLADLRQQYSAESRLDPMLLTHQAGKLVEQISRSMAAGLEEADLETLFDELAPLEKEQIRRKMISKGVRNPDDAMTVGGFLKYASSEILLKVFRMHPELFFDGNCWGEIYADLDFGTPQATDVARRSVVDSYANLLFDLSWLREQDSEEMLSAPREMLVRAVCALDLLSSNLSNGDE